MSYSTCIHKAVHCKAVHFRLRHLHQRSTEGVFLAEVEAEFEGGKKFGLRPIIEAEAEGGK